jgi:two-component system cell cycle sensor histidine kinase/response regulator CckA
LVRLQIAVDITRIKEMEEERQRNKETLDRARELEAIGTLAGGIAHDFNNLLQIISGNISLVGNDELLSSENLRYLEDVKGATDKAQELTNRLITFATGGVPNRVAMPITSLLRKIVTDLVEV